MKKKKPSSSNSKRDMLRYAGMGTQMLVSIGIAVFIGLRADRWLHTLPLFACVLPLLTLAAIFYKLMRQTGSNNNADKIND